MMILPDGFRKLLRDRPRLGAGVDVYMALAEDIAHRGPAEVKISAYATTLGMGKATLIDTLNTLVQAGCLIEHPRGGRTDVRCFSLPSSEVEPISPCLFADSTYPST
jgi:hypothetical protein